MSLHAASRRGPNISFVKLVITAEFKDQTATVVILERKIIIPRNDTQQKCCFVERGIENYSYQKYMYLFLDVLHFTDLLPICVWHV